MLIVVCGHVYSDVIEVCARCGFCPCVVGVVDGAHLLLVLLHVCGVACR